jgi:hypothetical protein
MAGYKPPNDPTLFTYHPFVSFFFFSKDVAARRNTFAMNPPIAIPPPPLSLRKRTHGVIFVFVLCLGQFLSLTGMIQTVSPLLILAEYFGIHDYGSLSWFSAAYSMTVGTFILPAGEPLFLTYLPVFLDFHRIGI